MNSCSVCWLHSDPEACARYEIGRGRTWILRHHPDPAPLPGWLLLDSRRYLGGPIDVLPEEAAAWGSAVQDPAKAASSTLLHWTLGGPWFRNQPRMGEGLAAEWLAARDDAFRLWQ